MPVICLWQETAVGGALSESLHTANTQQAEYCDCMRKIGVGNSFAVVYMKELRDLSLTRVFSLCLLEGKKRNGKNGTKKPSRNRRTELTHGH